MALEVIAIIVSLAIIGVFLELCLIPGNRRKDLPPGTHVALHQRSDLGTHILQGHPRDHSLAIFTNYRRPERIFSRTLHQS